MDIVTDTLSALWKVLAVGILLGAGLPALYALGLRSMNSGRTVNADGTVSGSTSAAGRAVGLVILAVVIAIALFGIVVIVWGKQIFGA
ncbi:hypothetical protein GCM10011575_12000 [Microlunatus endophyticus]|uniref:Uncharacterized protein n=1 Tax=Microlunatus endophyticus TaxID=1716077 RepID=A0A917W2S8_9ACTN|nr:hypothetical protein [Microlunatus endophyticus]GGL55213.1 hypothetical protein GCM10011575_12000 [Microlunatus endophyticus]